MSKELYIEIVKERLAPGPRGIISSSFRTATKKDVLRAGLLHDQKDVDPHLNAEDTVFYDEAGWMYDLRRCGICESVLALI